MAARSAAMSQHKQCSIKPRIVEINYRYRGPDFLGHGLRVNLSSREVVRWDQETGETRETMARWAERNKGVARAERSPTRAAFTRVLCPSTGAGAHAARPRS